MSWNHRVVKRRLEHLGVFTDHYAIHECFYTERGKGWTESPVTVEGESIEELRVTLERMLAALDRPVIEDDGQ